MTTIWLTFIVLNGIFVLFCLSVACVWWRSQFFRFENFQNLTPEQVERLAKADDIPHFNAVLEQLIQPRIVGTPSHEVVKNYIIKWVNEVMNDAVQSRWRSLSNSVSFLVNWGDLICTLNSIHLWSKCQLWVMWHLRISSPGWTQTQTPILLWPVIMTVNWFRAKYSTLQPIRLCHVRWCWIWWKHWVPHYRKRETVRISVWWWVS